MNTSDQYSLVLHRLVADRLIVEPRKTIEFARKNIERWIRRSKTRDAFSESYFEWRDILNSKTDREIRDLILSESDEGQRLRSTTPFSGLLAQKDILEALRKCEKVGFV